MPSSSIHSSRDSSLEGSRRGLTGQSKLIGLSSILTPRRCVKIEIEKQKKSEQSELNESPVIGDSDEIAMESSTADTVVNGNVL